MNIIVDCVYFLKALWKSNGVLYMAWYSRYDSSTITDDPI